MSDRGTGWYDMFIAAERELIGCRAVANHLTSVNIELHRKIDVMQREVQGWMNQMEAQRKRADTAQREIERLQAWIRAHGERCEPDTVELTKRANTAEARHEAAQQEIGRLQAVYGTQSQDIRIAQIDALEEENERLRIENTRLQDVHTNTRDMLNQAEQDLTRTEVQVRALQGERDRARADLREFTDTMAVDTLRTDRDIWKRNAKEAQRLAIEKDLALTNMDGERAGRIIALEAQVRALREVLERVERALDHHDDGNGGPCGCVFHRVIHAALATPPAPEGKPS